MNEDGPLDARYFEWLYSQVGNLRERNPTKSHILLCEALYKLPFEYYVPNDHNRAEDGRRLRKEYFQLTGDLPDYEWIGLDCSMLEMLIGLSHRLQYQSNVHRGSWFFELLTNMGIVAYNDENFNDGFAQAVHRAAKTICTRTYEASGRGGLFPLRYPEEDQREVEIWYQMSAYLIEQDEFG